MRAIALVLLAACASTPPPPDHAASPPASPPSSWPVPDGWRSELIPFPLDFAPSLAHRGIEELRFAPGFFDPAAAGYWAYAFAWRLDDDPPFDATSVGGELTTYFRGLIAAVDEKHEISNTDTIVVRATAEGPRLALAAHMIDAFKTKQPVELAGTAVRRACTKGSLWVFALAPAHATIRGDVDALAARAACDQAPVPNKKQ